MYDLLNRKKQVIGRTSHVKMLGRQGKSAISLAKIDSGAYSVSIDIELAKQLGFTQLMGIFDEKEMISSLGVNEVRGKELYKELFLKLKPSYPDLADISIIFSGNGYSFRPCIKIVMEIEGKKFETVVNITDRKAMDYKVIIGRKLLKNFLIDVNVKDEKDINNSK